MTKKLSKKISIFFIQKILPTYTANIIKGWLFQHAIKLLKKIYKSSLQSEFLCVLESSTTGIK